jgi:hypothetical protein
VSQNELLTAVKSGLSVSGSYNDTVLTQKMLAVTGYMTNAGVSETNLYSDLGVACICIGVTDLWNLTGGEIQFSPAFGMLVEQLVVVSLPDAEV